MTGERRGHALLGGVQPVHVTGIGLAVLALSIQLDGLTHKGIGIMQAVCVLIGARGGAMAGRGIACVCTDSISTAAPNDWTRMCMTHPPEKRGQGQRAPDLRPWRAGPDSMDRFLGLPPGTQCGAPE